MISHTISPSLLKNEVRVLAEAKIQEIADVLTTRTITDAGNSNISFPALAGGGSGIALFFAYLSIYKQESSYLDISHELLGYCFDLIERHPNVYTFAGGIAGTGWTLSHMIKYHLLDADPNILSDIDGTLTKYGLMAAKEGNYDYLHGGLGCGLYFLDRLPNPVAKDFLEKLVNVLHQTAEFTSEGIRWQDPRKFKHLGTMYNLGLAHGITSIIVFLAQVYSQGIATSQCYTLLSGAIKYLLNHQLTEDHFVCFPSVVHSIRETTHSRLAWCYGDLGISIALYQAGMLTAQEDWMQKAIEIADKTTLRRSVEETLIKDAGLCHGFIGVAHIYHRMFQYTQKFEFAEAAQYWFEEGLAFGNNPQGSAGYLALADFDENGKLKWGENLGFLQGIAGIGLGLIGAVSTISPAWDRSLLLS